MQTNHLLFLKKLKNTESAQLWFNPLRPIRSNFALLLIF